MDRELEKLTRLLQLYGEEDFKNAITQALSRRTFGARYVGALLDQARFARGLQEPPEPILTGNTTADSSPLR